MNVWDDFFNTLGRKDEANALGTYPSKRQSTVGIL